MSEVTQFQTGAVRDSAAGKGMPSEIPPTVMRRIAGRFEFGAVQQNYGKGNWRKGMLVSRFLDGIDRHSWAVKEGKTDEDHEAAIAWNAMGLMWTLEEIAAGRLPAELDDRPFVIRQPVESHDTTSHGDDLGATTKRRESDR